MKKISSDAKWDIGGTLFISVFLIGTIRAHFIVFLMCLFYFLAGIGHLYKLIKNNEFWEVIIDKSNFIFNRNNFDLIRTKFASKLKSEAWIINKGRKRLLNFYNNIYKIDNSTIQELIEIMAYHNSNSKESKYIRVLINNLLFLIHLKEKNFTKAYDKLQEIKVYFRIKKTFYVPLTHIDSTDILHQTIDGEFILSYLFKHISNENVEDIIKLLISFDNRIGIPYLESLPLEKEYIDYLKTILNLDSQD